MKNRWYCRIIWTKLIGGLAFLSLTQALASQAIVPLPPSSLAGAWSFDGSCASGDGMVLKADGKASSDEWGDGLWVLADTGQRLVLIVEDISEDAGRRKAATLVEFKITRGSGGTLVLTRLSDNAKINAVKCKPN